MLSLCDAKFMLNLCDVLVFSMKIFGVLYAWSPGLLQYDGRASEVEALISIISRSPVAHGPSRVDRHVSPRSRSFSALPAASILSILGQHRFELSSFWCQYLLIPSSV